MKTVHLLHVIYEIKIFNVPSALFIFKYRYFIGTSYILRYLLNSNSLKQSIKSQPLREKWESVHDLKSQKSESKYKIHQKASKYLVYYILIKYFNFSYCNQS